MNNSVPELLNELQKTDEQIANLQTERTDIIGELQSQTISITDIKATIASYKVEGKRSPNYFTNSKYAKYFVPTHKLHGRGKPRQMYDAQAFNALLPILAELRAEQEAALETARILEQEADEKRVQQLKADMLTLLGTMDEQQRAVFLSQVN